MPQKTSAVMGVGGRLGVFLLIVGGCLCRRLSSPSSHIVAVFEDTTADNATVNNHLVVHKETGVLYVGAVNRIYQLDPNLRLIAYNKTGPYKDSPECLGYGECPDTVHVTFTNNVNKALVIDYSRAKLISCGSLYQGTCWVMGLENVSSTTDLDVVNEPIVANNESASTVAFIAPGPPTPPTSTVSKQHCVLFYPFRRCRYGVECKRCTKKERKGPERTIYEEAEVCSTLRILNKESNIIS